MFRKIFKLPERVSQILILIKLVKCHPMSHQWRSRLCQPLSISALHCILLGIHVYTHFIMGNFCFSTCHFLHFNCLRESLFLGTRILWILEQLIQTTKEKWTENKIYILFTKNKNRTQTQYYWLSRGQISPYTFLLSVFSLPFIPQQSLYYTCTIHNCSIMFPRFPTFSPPLVSTPLFGNSS